MTWIVLGRITQAFLALVALRIMTAMLSPEEVGRWSLLLAVAAFFVLGLVNPIGMFINRRLHSWVEFGKVRRYMAYYSLYLLGVATLAGLALYVAHTFYAPVPGMSIIWMVGLVVSMIIFATLNQTYTPSLNLLGYRGWFVLLALATVMVSLIVSVGLVYWISPSAEWWQAGQILGQLMMALVGGALFFHLIKQHQREKSDAVALRITIAKLTLVFAFAWPLAISVLFTWVQTQSYRFLVQDTIGLEALGLFVVGYGISASLIGIFESVISTYFIPAFYKRTASENRHEQALAWHEYTSAMLVSLLITIAIVVSVSDELARVLLDVKFAQAAQYVVWGVLAEAARVTVATYALVAHAGMDTKKLIVPNIIGAIAAPLFVFLFVTDWGAHGVGIGLAAAGFMAIISSHLVLSRSFEIIMPWTKLLRTGMIALLIIVFAEVGHGVVGVSDTFTASLLWLSGMGTVMLMVLFILLKSQINREVV